MEVVRIQDPHKPGDFVVINADDFDPELHVPFEAAEPVGDVAPDVGDDAPAAERRPTRRGKGRR